VKAVWLTLLAGGYLCGYYSPVQAQLSAGAIEAYQQQNWELAIRRLESQKAEAGAMRMLALSYFRMLDFDRALPALREALLISPDDKELNSALLEVLLAERLYPEAASVSKHLENLGASDLAMLGQARIELAQGDRRLAKDQLRDLVDQGNLEVSTRAADLLIEMLYQDEQFEQAYEVAQTAMQRYPDSALAFRFSWIRPPQPSGPGFSADLGYRIAYAANVTFPDETVASNKEDFRHVLMADLLYERPFGNDWAFYAQGHFLQSFYHDLDEFNQTRIAGAVAIGQTNRKIGWRFPVEVSYDRIDGDSFRTSLITRPGFYIQFGNSFFSHFYARLQSDDYNLFRYAEEDRSGDVSGAGVLVVGQVSPRFHLRTYIEFNHYDTDGSHWKRDEIVAFAFGEFEFIPNWVAGFAFRYQDEDYDNARPIFEERQHDKSKEFYLTLNHEFAEKWRWRGQISLIDHQSNIPIFDYDRNVYSFSIIRDF